MNQIRFLLVHKSLEQTKAKRYYNFFLKSKLEK
jgi:hypothetical protein